MSVRSLGLSDELHQYLVEHGSREDDLRRRLREETSKLEWARMQISPEQGDFMAMIVRLMGARRGIEIGTFTGYSALCVARAMGDEGELICCDIHEEWTSIATRYWDEAGVRGRIDLRLAPAVDTLEALFRSGREEEFDFVFIDADKTNYLVYYDYALRLLRPGGLVMIDNVLWSGAVVDPSDYDEDTVAIRRLNDTIASDPRVDVSMLPIGDGLTLAIKRA